MARSWGAELAAEARGGPQRREDRGAGRYPPFLGSALDWSSARSARSAGSGRTLGATPKIAMGMGDNPAASIVRADR